MKSALTLFFAVFGLLFACCSCDSSFRRDGLHYEFCDGGVMVAQSDINPYVGTIKIPDTITYKGVNYAVVGIDDEAFADCKLLTSLLIPKTVKKIGRNAFAGCVGLKTLLCQVPMPLVTDSLTFQRVDLKHCTLYVPLQSAPSYASDLVWGQFASIYEVGEYKTDMPLPIQKEKDMVKTDDHGE